MVCALVGIAMLSLACGHGHTPLFMWNASASVPLGLYRLHRSKARYLGELVAVLPPDPLATFLANGSYLPRGVPMLKHVLALPGQTVCRVGSSIFVDTIAMGDARERDSRGRPLPVWEGCRVIADGQLFLMNAQSTDSLDGRYFGPISSSAVIARAQPVWIEKE
ncbi:MAG: S26 family signal peptidase [Reyranella sp.]|jgi:conjugative transfer signal peptidase TraF|nr:S26 family signal peptidase [Reyranella sp.]